MNEWLEGRLMMDRKKPWLQSPHPHPCMDAAWTLSDKYSGSLGLAFTTSSGSFSSKAHPEGSSEAAPGACRSQHPDPQPAWQL